MTEVSEEAQVVFDSLLVGDCGIEHVNPKLTHVWIELMALWLDSHPNRSRAIWVSYPKHAFSDEHDQTYQAQAVRLREELADFAPSHLLEGLCQIGRRLSAAFVGWPPNEVWLSRDAWLNYLGGYPCDDAELLLDALVSAEVASYHLGNPSTIGFVPHTVFRVADRLEHAFFVHTMACPPAMLSSPGQVRFRRRRLWTAEHESYNGLEVSDPRNVTLLWGWHAYDSGRMRAPLKIEPPWTQVPVHEFWKEEEGLARQAVQVIRETLERELRGRYQGEEK